MAGILVYALHDDEGNFNKNSLGAVSEAARLAGELGTQAGVVVVGDVSDEAAQSLGAYGASKVHRAKNVPEGLAQPIVDVMAKVITDDGYDYVLFGGGLLGFEIGAGLTARLGAGVTMEVTAVKVAGRRAGRRAPDPAGLADRRRRLRRQAGHHHRPPERVRRDGARRRLGRGGRRRRRAVALVHARRRWSRAASSAART